jgi:hypothetical protein
MRVRLTVTLDVDEEAWASAYGVDGSRLRDDVRHHVAATVESEYVERLRLARETVVRRESSHRVGNPFR